MTSPATRLEAAGCNDSEAAFTQLVQTHENRVFSLCYRFLGDAAEAEEVAQETFLRAYLHRRHHDPTRPVRPWLMAIAAHGCIDRLRRRRLTWVSLEAAQGWEHPALAHPGPGPEAALLQAERCQAVQRLLARLTAADLSVVVMHYWGDLSYAEIAATLGATVSAVKSRLHRARRRLAELLQQPAPAGRPGYRWPGAAARHEPAYPLTDY
jgi:RNA polymerase sigma-70 factor (ECF subfamily)